jgi:uncharacterized protein
MPRLLLDPWSPDYEAPIQTDGAEAAASGEVDAEVETWDWRPIGPSEKLTERRLYFVDGVRRVEARVLSQENDGSLIHGLFASAGVGSVVTENGAARYDCVEVRRYLILGTGKCKTESIAVGSQTILFEGTSNAGDTPDELINCLQNLMRTREAALAESLLAEGACVFADGPLNYFSAPAGALVGVIKRIFLPYLDAGHFALVGQLATGERTPLFSIRDGKYDRYAWFQRLATPRPMEHSLAGIVRLEVRAALGLLQATELANLAAVRLPRFASSAVRDPRAPQNLVPVGALEEQLRHRLGDAVTIRRAIERKIWDGVTI